MDTIETTDSGIGQRIFDLRVEHDIQQGELAQAIHLHQSVLNRIEKGTRPARDYEVRAIARFFQVSADYLLGLPASHIAEVHAADPMPELSAAELALIRKYRALDARGRNAVVDTLQREYSYATPPNQKNA